MTNTLGVYWDKKLVGHLITTDEQPLTFTYEKAWIQSPGMPLSLSLPIRNEPFYKEGQTFFGNLLPEGDFRSRIEQLFKVSAG